MINQEHIMWMHRAYELSMRGWGKVSPNPMVGACIVKNGRLIAEGWHSQYGQAHAEVMAITAAGKKAHGADLYVTLEPCNHVGKTGPCTQAIIAAGIKRVFVGVKDPNPLMNGQSIKYLKRRGITVSAGFMGDELNRLNEAFNKYIVSHMPFVTAKIAQTIDAKTADDKGQSKWITSEQARQYAKGRRYGFDAIMVGINTVLKDDPSLNPLVKKRIKKVIIDTKGRMPKKGKLYINTVPDDILVYTAVDQLKVPATVIGAPLYKGYVDLTWVMKDLARRHVAQVLIEGGATLVGNALARGLVDKMMVYIAPKFFGAGHPSLVGLSCSLEQALKLDDINIERIGDDLFLEGYVHRNH